MKKLAVTLLVLLALAGLGYVGWRVHLKLQAETGGSGRAPRPVAVEAALLRRATLRDLGRFTGSLVADGKFMVAPQVGGRLKKLLVDLGDPVQRGQLIALLDDQEYIQQVERAKAELAVAEASVQECQSNLQNALREYDRVAALRAKKIASESEYDQAVAQLEVQKARGRVAEAQVTHRQAVLREAQIRLSYTTVQAVWEGGADTRYVGERLATEGALLLANQSIVSVIDLTVLTAVVHVIERDFAKMAAGQAASVATDAYPGRIFPGRIARIAPQLQETSRQARIEIRVPNEDLRLKPGMFVRVELKFAEHEDVLTVPRAALAIRDGRRGVFLAGGGTARFVPVELGIEDGDLFEVVSPVLEGPVVVMGQHLLADGASLRIVDAPPGSRPAGTGR